MNKRQVGVQKMETLLGMVKTLESYSCENETEEAQMRNTALVKRHGKIPSYSLWYEDCIGNEKECLEWWKGFLNDLEPEKLDEESVLWFSRIAKSMVRGELVNIKERSQKLTAEMSEDLEMLDVLSDDDTFQKKINKNIF